MKTFQQSTDMCLTHDQQPSNAMEPMLQQPMGNAAVQQMLTNPSPQKKTEPSSGPSSLFKAGSRVAPANNIAKMGNAIGMGPGKDLGPAAGPFAVGFGAYNTVAGVDKMANGNSTDEQVEGGMQTAGGLSGILAGANGVGALLGLGEAAFVNPYVAAAAAGFGTGLATGTRGDQFVKEHGFIGEKNKDGTNKSISDWVGDEGYDAYEDAHVALAGTPLEDTWAEEALAVGNGLSTAAPRLLFGSAFSAMTGVAGFAEDFGEFVIGD